MNTIDIEPDRKPPYGTSPRTSGVWIAVVAVVAIGAAAVLWRLFGGAISGDGDPWGLSEIEMPGTQAEVLTVFENMPEIDGRRPAVSSDEERITIVYDGTETEGAGTEPLIWATIDSGLDPHAYVEGLQEHVDAIESGGWTIEESVLDPEADLVWVLASDRAPGEGTPMYVAMWGEPKSTGAFFSLVADTADFRTKLVEAFVTAVEG